jgi:hypothetical protein
MSATLINIAMQVSNSMVADAIVASHFQQVRTDIIVGSLNR